MSRDYSNLSELEEEVEEIYQDLKYKRIERTREWIYENMPPHVQEAELEYVGNWLQFTEQALKDALEVKICMIKYHYRL